MKRLLPLVLVALTGCASLDPLGSPKLQARDPEVTYTPDFPVQSGVICREVTGQANVRGEVNGTVRGVRCQKIGTKDLEGCLKWGGEGAGFSYESPGCNKPDEGLLKQVEALQRALEDAQAAEALRLNRLEEEMGLK